MQATRDRRVGQPEWGVEILAGMCHTAPLSTPAAFRRSVPVAHSDSHHAPPPFQDAPPPGEFEPEITLADYLMVLARRRWLVAAVVAGSLAAGLLHAAVAVRSHTFRTAVEIGRNGVDNKLIDEPETILAKLTHAYIPDVLRAYRADHPEGRRVQVDAKIPKGSQLVVLESRGPKDAEPVYRALHEATIDKLIGDHRRTSDEILTQYASERSRAAIKLDELADRRIFAVQEKFLQGEIERGQLRLGSLRDQAGLIEAEAKRLDETKKLLTQQVADVRAVLATANDRRAKAVAEATDEARAMTLLMIDSQIMDSRSRLGALEERLYISIENERERLVKQLADIRRDQEAQSTAIGELGSKFVKLRVDHEREKVLQQQTIDDIDAKIAGVRPTRVLLAPAASLDPVGAGKKALLAVYGLVGLIGGIVAAFFAEFVATTRAQLRASGNGAAALGDAEVARRPSRNPLHGGGFSVDPHDRLGARGADDHPAPVVEVELEDALDLGPPRDRQTSDHR